MTNKKKLTLAMLCGMLGCLCFGGGDWLMICGDPAHSGKLSWLTAGTAAIPQWRYDLAMALAFPGIILYGIGLFTVEGLITDKKGRRTYHWLNAFGLTPWIALHLFYVMILSLYSWLGSNGFGADAEGICEGLFGQLSWLVPLSEAFMLPVFVYWFWVQIRGRTAFHRAFAFTNVLVIFALLKAVSMLMPVSGFRLGFTNGLMSESMIVWFGIILVYGNKAVNKQGV